VTFFRENIGTVSPYIEQGIVDWVSVGEEENVPLANTGCSIYYSLAVK